MKTRRVVILMDHVPPGAPADRRDALTQADAVSRALGILGFSAEVLEVTLNLEEAVAALSALCPDLVFNLVESLDGQGRLIHMVPALLDSLGIPYTGSDTDAIYLTSNKILAKRCMRAAEIPTPFFLDEKESPSEPIPAGPYIVKSVWEHASIGLDEDAVVSGVPHEEPHRAMADRRERMGGACFAEQYIDGREFNLSLLQGKDRTEVLPPAEIRFPGYPAGKHKVVGYRAKWDEDSFEYRHTQRAFDVDPADAALMLRLQEIALDCWRVFDLKGYARVDFRVDRSGCPWVLEVNANPCLSHDAGFVKAAEEAGLDLTEVVRRIVEAACPEKAHPCGVQKDVPMDRRAGAKKACSR